MHSDEMSECNRGFLHTFFQLRKVHLQCNLIIHSSKLPFDFHSISINGDYVKAEKN